MEQNSEEISVVKKLLPYGRDQALELCLEVVKLLSKEGAMKEEFSIDEEPSAARKTGVETWLGAMASSATQPPWMKVSLELAGCLLKNIRIETHFSSKKSFQTTLGDDPTPGWVLEQTLATRKETESVCRALCRTKSLTFESQDDLLHLAELLDVATSGLSKARNSLLFPNPLGFPRALRPFNGFSPPLGPEFLLDFSLFRDRLVVAAYRISHQPTVSAPYYQGVVPDQWFEDPAFPAPPRMVDTTFMFEGGVAVKVLEQHKVSFQVALFTKVQVFLGDAQRVLQDLSSNVVACLAVRPDFFLSSVRNCGDDAQEEENDFDRMPLVQAGDVVSQLQQNV